MDGNNNFNQNVYSQPNTYTTEAESPNSVGDWVLTLFLTCIPIVGIVLLFVWAFGGNTQKSKANWAKAQLIWTAVGIIFTIIFYVSIGAAIINSLNGI